MTSIQPQKKFPLLKEYQQVFDITPYTIFAYNDIIYTDYELTGDLLIHEQVHLKRQKKLGLDKWVKRYLKDKQFRLAEEVIAYTAQLESIKDRELRNRVRLDSAKTLSSSLYGELVTFEEALKLLK